MSSLFCSAKHVLLVIGMHDDVRTAEYFLEEAKEADEGSDGLEAREQRLLVAGLLKARREGRLELELRQFAAEAHKEGYDCSGVSALWEAITSNMTDVAYSYIDLEDNDAIREFGALLMDVLLFSRGSAAP